MPGGSGFPGGEICTSSRRYGGTVTLGVASGSAWHGALASIGAIGLIVAVSGFAANRSANFKLSEVRPDLADRQQINRELQSQLPEMAKRPVPAVSEAAVDVLAAPVTPAPMAPVTPARVPQMLIAKAWPAPPPTAVPRRLTTRRIMTAPSQNRIIYPTGGFPLEPPRG